MMIGVALLILCSQVSVISTQIRQYVTYDTQSQVQNIIYDETNRRVFVGATNQILRLSVSII